MACIDAMTVSAYRVMGTSDAFRMHTGTDVNTGFTMAQATATWMGLSKASFTSHTPATHQPQLPHNMLVVR